MNPAIQVVVYARLESVKDAYMDKAAVLKLKQDLLDECHGERVVASVVDNVLTATVTAGGHDYSAHVKLSRYVPSVEPDGTLVNISEDQLKTVMDNHYKAQAAANEKANADRAEAAAREHAASKKD
jgi:hypothetical protein